MWGPFGAAVHACQHLGCICLFVGSWVLVCLHVLCSSALCECV